MAEIRREDVFRLLDSQIPLSVSIYMPVEVTGREVRQNSGRLKNLLNTAEQLLNERGTPLRDVRGILQPGLELVANEHFWSVRCPGLAVYLAPAEHYAYRLPTRVEESVTLGNRYRLRPALCATQFDAWFYLLAISQNRVRLMRVTKADIEELAVPDLPKDMVSALNYASADRGEQVHSGMTGRRGKQAAVFHGQGGEPDALKDDLCNYFRVIDDSVRNKVKEESAEVMLACVDYLAPLYHQVTELSTLIVPMVEGNPDYCSLHQLHQKAWPVFEDRCMTALNDQLADLTNSPRPNHAVFDTCEIVDAAQNGRVATLYLDRERDVWGAVEQEGKVVDIHDVKAPNDQELMELAASQTLRHNGRVYCVAEDQLPTAAPMAAVLRFC